MMIYDPFDETISDDRLRQQFAKNWGAELVARENLQRCGWVHMGSFAAWKRPFAVDKLGRTRPWYARADGSDPGGPLPQAGPSEDSSQPASPEGRP